MNIHEHLPSVPDIVKVTIATGSSVLTIFGIPVEQWTYILSGIVSLFFIVEKLPMVIKRAREMYVYFKS